jgi:hypothetical protein
MQTPKFWWQGLSTLDFQKPFFDISTIARFICSH